MEKKYFNNNGHPTAIFVPKGMYYSLEGLEAKLMGCYALDGKLTATFQRDKKGITYNKEDPFEPFPGAVKSGGETIIVTGDSFLKCSGQVVPEGYRMHCIEEEWDSETIGSIEKRDLVEFEKLNIRNLQSIHREVERALRGNKKIH